MRLRARQCVAQQHGHYYCPQEGALWSPVTGGLAREQMEEIEQVSLSTSFLNENIKER